MTDFFGIEAAGGHARVWSQKGTRESRPYQTRSFKIVYKSHTTVLTHYIVWSVHFFIYIAVSIISIAKSDFRIALSLNKLKN
jgi:hypothetical protein